MAMDSLSQALAQRRGKGLDGSLLHGASHEIAAEDTPQDVRKGLASGGPGHEAHLAEHEGDHPGIDHRLGVDGKNTPAGEHNLPNLQGPEGGEHIGVANEGSMGAMTHTLTTGPMEGGDLKDQIREHVIGHQGENEKEQLMGMGHKPRSLGERAKMAALMEKK